MSGCVYCGPMLYELLAGEHPYWRNDQAEYAALVMAYGAKPPALLDTMAASCAERGGECRATPPSFAGPWNAFKVALK